MKKTLLSLVIALIASAGVPAFAASIDAPTTTQQDKREKPDRKDKKDKKDKCKHKDKKGKKGHRNRGPEGRCVQTPCCPDSCICNPCTPENCVANNCNCPAPENCGPQNCDGQRPGKGHKGFGNKPNEDLRGITLTEEQQAKIDKLNQEYRATRNKIQTENLQKSQKAREEYDKDIAKILTPEQLQQYNANKESNRGKLQGAQKKGHDHKNMKVVDYNQRKPVKYDGRKLDYNKSENAKENK